MTPFPLSGLLRQAFALLLVCWGLAWLPPAATAQPLAPLAESAVVRLPEVRAELVAHAPQGLARGQPLWLGLLLEHAPDWHTYWKNPGDTGLPTQLQWTLPSGLQAGEIDWPTPELIRVGPLGNYGYSHQMLLPVPVTVGAGLPEGDTPLTVRLHASWLICKTECIPQEGRFVLELPRQGSIGLHASVFAAARERAPRPHTGSLSAAVSTEGITLEVQGLSADWQGKTLAVFPEAPNIADPSTSPSRQGWRDGIWSALLPLSPQREGTVDDLVVVLAEGGRSVRASARVSGEWPPLSQAGYSEPTPTSTLPAAPASAPYGSGWVGFVLALAAALAGGLLLNLMPCVLPVLAIKVLGLTRQQSVAQRRHEGLAYSAGVVLSCLALGGALVALRAAGAQWGWGFQLQTPAVVVALALLFTLLALNLLGLFHFGQWLPQSVAGVQWQHPVANAFGTGVLAVAVASPCTAPFMGAALGYALVLPAPQALALFGALGLGLALPLLLVSWVPSWARWLPRPGAWMETLRRFLAFPLLGTVVWLLWVLGHLNGVDSAATLLALLLALALLLWTLGLAGRSRAVLGSTALVLMLGLIGVLGPALWHDSSARSPNAEAGPWQPWSPQRVEAALAQGQPVFVDFTAAWCITCQVNKKTTLDQPGVLADFQARKVLLLRADWTRRDATIGAALAQLGRSGVPVYVLYQAQRPPVVLSEILSAGDIRTALASLR